MRRELKAIFLLFFTVQFGFAQVTFKAAVSKTSLGMNERLRVDFTIDKQGADDFTPPRFENFTVLAGPSQATSFSSINGKTSFKQTYTYIIQPLSKGSFLIGSASITYDGEIIKSNAVRVQVTDAVNIPKDSNDPRYLASQNVHLVAEVSNVNPYVGESFSVIYKLYVNTGKVNVQNTRETSSPAFDGFWKQNIEVSDWQAQDGTFQGEPYRFVVVKKVVLIPNRAGKLQVDPLEMEIVAGTPMGRRDFFGNMMFEETNFTVTTGNRTIEVKALPEENKPVDFKGAVGSFKFNVTAGKTNLKANESTNIKVEVTGNGNLKLIELPKFVSPVGLEIFEPEHQEKINVSLSGLQGTVYDQYAIVPQFKGKFKIPEVSFSYFDPKAEKYFTIVSDPLIIDAPEGKELTEDDSRAISKQSVPGKETNIRFIKTKADLKPAEEKTDFYGSVLFYILLLAPLLAIPVGIFLGNKKEERDQDVVGNKRRKADRLARKYLSEARKKLGNKELFYEALERALHNYLKGKLQAETADISIDKVAELLQNKKVEQTVIDELITVLDDCNYARYTPTTNVMMEQEYEKAKSVLAKLDRFLS
jgi:hypothetical protein